MNCALGVFSAQPTADYGAEMIDQRMDRFQIYLTLLDDSAPGDGDAIAVSPINFYQRPHYFDMAEEQGMTN